MPITGVISGNSFYTPLGHYKFVGHRISGNGLQGMYGFSGLGQEDDLASALPLFDTMAPVVGPNLNAPVDIIGAASGQYGTIPANRTVYNSIMGMLGYSTGAIQQTNSTISTYAPLVVMGVLALVLLKRK